jgi:hypothetical protein
MKNLLTVLTIILLSVNVFSQSPNGFKYQAVVRNSGGQIIANTLVGIRISILQSSAAGASVCTETFTPTTNEFGIANLEVGSTNPVSFSAINWSSGPFFIKVELDPIGGTNYIVSGTSELLSVPYALYAKTAGNADTLWNINGNNIYNTNTRNVGIGTSTPPGKLVVQGDNFASPSDPLFEVKNKTGQTIFAVYEDSVNVFVNDDAIQSNRGGFAVSGRNSAKAITNNYLRVTPDSTRIWTTDTIAGFGVENIGSGTSSSYLRLNRSNYFIGHNSGDNVTTGLYNSTFGYKADSSLQTGTSNIVIGYEAGKGNIWGSENVFMGYQSGFSNNTGGQNVFIGYQSGYTYSGQFGAVCIGAEAGKFTSGPDNVMIGRFTGRNSTGGSNNVMVGSFAGTNFTGGNSVIIGTSSGAGSGGWNTFLGCNVADGNTTGNYNLFAGWRSADGNTTGSHNVFMGYYSGRLNTTGDNNTYIGDNAGYSNITGTGNVCLGYMAGYSETLSNKLYIENSNNSTTPLVHGDFSTNRIAFHRLASTYPLQVGTTTANGNGAFLTAGGVWTAGSSRSFKDRFVDLNGQDVLNKIAAMDLKGWFYKETQEYHIGPFAEDFYQAFGTGDLSVKEDLGKYLSATDVSGVSMIAIKELVNENKKMLEEINKLKIDMENLKTIIISANK